MITGLITVLVIAVLALSGWRPTPVLHFSSAASLGAVCAAALLGPAVALPAYDYDAPSQAVATTHDVARVAATSTTSAITSRTAPLVTRSAIARMPSAPTSSMALRRATKGAAGAADDGARLATGRFLSDSWHRATFPNKTQSVRYHWQKHVRDQGLNKSVREYTEDALGVFQQHRSAAQQITLKDGTPGLRIKTGKGQPGGFYTPDGRVVTFWYR